jgi:hypothetical protein
MEIEDNVREWVDGIYLEDFDAPAPCGVLSLTDRNTLFRSPNSDVQRIRDEGS